MSGLFEKDLRLLLKRKQSLIIFVAISLITGYANGPFILGYMPLLFCILAVSTIAYDEADQGFTYMFSLPIDRKAYAIEKYAFCLAAELIALVFAGVVYAIMGNIQGETVVVSDLLSTLIMFLPIISTVTAIVIPVQIKFGAEGSRVAMIAIAGVFAIAGVILVRLAGKTAIDSVISSFLNLPELAQIALAVICTIIMLIVSLIISINVLSKKEF